MTYFLTSFRSGAIPSASVPMVAVASLEFQKNLQGEVLVSSAQPALMGRLPGFMVLAELGTTFPFSGNQEVVEQFSKGRSSRVKDFLVEKSPLGRPLTITASPADTTPLLPVQKLVDFDWGKYTPIKRYQHRALTEKPGWTMFPAFVPANAYTTDSCTLLSEIQRHMLEKTIDGGLTWSDLWTKSEVQKFFNNRLSRFYLETGVIQEEFSVPVTAFTSEYDYPADLVQAKRLAIAPPIQDTSSLRRGLLSFWKMDEASGETRIDSIGNNDLLNINNVASVPGVLNGASSFVGATPHQYLEGTTSPPYWTNSFTIAGWLYDFSQSIRNLVTWNNVLTGSSVVRNFDVRRFQSFIGFSGAYDAVPNLPVPEGLTPDGSLVQGRWQHIACVWDSSGSTDAERIKIYIDGVLQTLTFSTVTPNKTIGGGDQNTLWFGQRNSVSPAYTGYMDEWGLWNRPLSEEDILKLIQLSAHQVLVRIDPFGQDNGNPGWEVETGTPTIIIEEPRNPLSFQLSPTPSQNMSVEGIYVAEPDDITDACTLLPIPNFLTWIIKYGVMSDMLRKEGEANDPQRAEYCERRWKEGVALTRILLGFGEEGDNKNE